ncbi:MAG: glutathione S-transferase family protein [Pseudomonadota bacterium]
MLSPALIAAFATVAIAAIGLWWRREAARRRSHPVSGGLQPDVEVPSETEFELYSNSFSHCSRKVRLALAELHIDYTHRATQLIETGWYETISPAYLRVNPAGLLPTLVHRGRPIYESDDILRYAQGVAGRNAPSLTPDGLDKRAEMERWIAFGSISSADAMGGMDAKAGACIPGLTLPMFVAAIRHIPLKNILVGLLFHPDKRRPLFFIVAKLLGLRWTFRLPPARAIVDESARHMRRHLAALNAALDAGEGPWLLGPSYTLADASMGAMLLRLDEAGWLAIFAEEQDLTALLDYYGWMQERPSWRAAIIETPNAIIQAATEQLTEVRADPALRRFIYGS